jgi:hypothetical protein
MPKNVRPTALYEIDQAVQHLYCLVHHRWHPRSDTPDPDTPKDVEDALEDMRELTLELKGLWDYLRAHQARAA